MTTKEYLIPLDDAGQNQNRTRLVINRGNLIDLMFQYETLIDNHWTPIIRYDCAHGFFHRDTLYPNGDKVKQEIEMTSLDVAAGYAKHDIDERWQWYRERYIKQIKIK
jgi:hypothetical protein